MRQKLLLFGFFTLLLLSPTYAITCYNDTALNATVCNTTSQYVEYTHSSILQSLKGIISNFVEYTLNINLFGNIVSPPTYSINITSTQILPGNTTIPLELTVQDASRYYSALVQLYINNSLIFNQTYTPEVDGSIQINVPYQIYQETTLNVTALVYLKYLNGTLILQDTDSKLIHVVLSPFNITIESPQNTTYDTNTIEVKVKIVTPNTNGIQYQLVLTIFNSTQQSIYNYTTSISPSTISTLTTNLTFSAPDTYTLYTELISLTANNNTIKSISNSVTFTISEQAFQAPGGTVGGGGGAGGGAGGGGVTTTPEQQVNATQPVITEQPLLEEQQPQGTQATLPISNRNILIGILVALVLIYFATRRNK